MYCLQYIPLKELILFEEALSLLKGTGVDWGDMKGEDEIEERPESMTGYGV